MTEMLVSYTDGEGAILYAWMCYIREAVRYDLKLQIYQEVDYVRLLQARDDYIIQNTVCKLLYTAWMRIW